MRIHLVSLLLLAILTQHIIAPPCTGTLANGGNGCSACAQADSTACVECSAGYGAYTTAGCTICAKGNYAAQGQTYGCSFCGVGKTTLGTGKTTIADCITVIEDCTTQTSATVCTECASGKVPTTSGDQCVTAIASCTKQTSATVCTECVSGKAPITSGAECVTAIASCTTQASATVCTTCGTGKIPVNSGALCVTPIAFCKTQTLATECSECNFGYTISSDKKACSQNSSTSNLIVVRLTVGIILPLLLLLF